MTTETHNTHPGDHAPQPLALKSNAVLGPTPPLVERLRTDVLWHQRRGNDTIARDCKEAADEIERLRADLKAMEGFADLWYFVMDEAPREFEQIVSEWSPSRWMDEAAKLRRLKRAA